MFLILLKHAQSHQIQALIERKRLPKLKAKDSYLKEKKYGNLSRNFLFQHICLQI